MLKKCPRTAPDSWKTALALAQKGVEGGGKDVGGKEEVRGGGVFHAVSAKNRKKGRSVRMLAH
jgi:hypothetical protein